MSIFSCILRDCAILLAITVTDVAIAGHAIKDDFTWKDDDVVLMVARVIDVGTRPTDANNIGGNAWAVIEPVAILAGELDPTSVHTLHVTFYYSRITPGRTELPPKGCTILAIVQGENFIISDECKFMPDQAAMVVVDGLGDRRIIDTVNRLRKVRLAGGRAPSTTTATTQP
jgi:hypothetical protein